MAGVFIEARVERLENLIAEVWAAFAETDRRLDERFAETDRRLDKRFAETDRRLDKRFAETDRRLRELFAETDRRFKETDRRIESYFERTERELDRLSQEIREFKVSTNKRWGELANKMGTMAEDLVAPSVPRILRTVTGCAEEQIDMIAVRLRRRHPVDRGRSQEFDVVAVCGEYVLINETRSRLRVKDIDDFVELMKQARGFFPEYADRYFIGAIASLYVDESVVRYGQDQGLLVLGLGEDLMTVLNEPGFEPRKF